MPDSSCGSGAQCCLWRPDPGAKLLAPSWRHSPRVAAPTENACGLHNGAACTGWICGAPTPGRSFSGTELAPFAAGRGSHRRKGATCTTQRYARAGFVGPRPRAKLWRRAGAIRRGSRLPQKKGCDLHNVAPCTGSICRSPDLGAKLLAPSWRHSPRVAPPTAKACDLHNAALCTGWICRSPDHGAKLFGTGLAPFAAGPASHRKSVRPAQRSAMPGLDLWEPRPRGEASGAELAPFAAGRGSYRKSVRPAQRSAMHGLDLWEARPRGEASGAALAPFAAGRASHRGSGVFCCLWAVRPRGEALSDRAAHANAGSSAGRTRSAHSPASCVRRACRRRGCVRFRADAPAHGRRSFAGTPVPLP